MSFIIVLIYCAILYLDSRLSSKHFETKREKILYRTLVILAILISFPTALALQLDHIGASLSGLISLLNY